MNSDQPRWTAVLLATAVLLTIVLLVVAQGPTATYLPVVQAPVPTPTATATPVPTATPTPSPTPEPMVELRGIWISRFDWTSRFEKSDAAEIDAMVANVADAGFNVIYFQVRGEGDAFYTPGLEPWTRRLTGNDILGEDPGWDPLQRMIDQAHGRGIQVHAYINVYPIWTGCDTPPSDTTPRHFYYDLIDEHGLTGDKPNGLQWFPSGNIVCMEYQRLAPSSVFVDEHLIAVGQDLVTRYDVDGIHLDHIRYAGRTTSCDPVSEAAYGAPCFESNGEQAYEDWQRQQINGTVRKFYEQVVPLKPGLWLSAAVWPIHELDPAWGFGTAQQGNLDYYQDSKAWVQGGYIDSISPMIYTDELKCPVDSYWSRQVWETLVADFLADSNGRYIIPGIGATYCTFDEIAWRINRARALGTAGHAIFSYSSLATGGYFDDLRDGPYAIPAVVPAIPWHE